MGVEIHDFNKLGCNIEKMMTGIETPGEHGFIQGEDLNEIDNALMGVARAWGRPYGYWQEQGGSLVQNIFPIKTTENDQISSSSKKPLEMHTETAFHPWLPHYVILLCLRGDTNAGTTFVDLEELITHLTKREIDLLHQPIFRTSIDMSFLNNKQLDKSIMMPILYNNGTSIKYDRNLMKSDDVDGMQVLVKLADLVEKLKVTYYLRAGQMAVIENWRTIHGRTEFTPRYDGTDRWLKRVLVRKSMPMGCDVEVNKHGDFYIVNMVL